MSSACAALPRAFVAHGGHLLLALSPFVAHGRHLLLALSPVLHCVGEKARRSCVPPKWGQLLLMLVPCFLSPAWAHLLAWSFRALGLQGQAIPLGPLSPLMKYIQCHLVFML